MLPETDKLFMKVFLFLFILALVFSGTAKASPKTTTFQMKITKPDGNPLEAGSVSFLFTTLSPTGTCVLYVEQFNNISMATSGGFLVLNLGTGTQNYTGAGTGYTDIFNNSLSSMNCQGSGTYSPASSDRRRLAVQFNDGSGAGWQTLPSIDINSVPFANFASDAEKFSGKVVSDFILSSALPGSACTGAQVLTYSGGAFSCVSVAGTGTVTNVSSANSYISIATATTTPVLTLNVGTVANTVAAGNDSRIIGAAQKANNLSDLASPSTARTNLGLGTAAVLDVGTAATNLVQLDGSAKIPAALLPSSAVSSSTSLVGDVTGTVGATVVSAVGSKTAAAVAQSVTDTQAATNTNTTSTIVKRDASGNIAIAALNATSATVSGNVGIGTLFPATALDVLGTASVASSVESASSYVSSSTAYTIPDATTNIRRITLTDNATITLPAFASLTGKVWTITVMIKQDATGGRTLTWAVPGGDSILWDQSATAPAPSSGASKTTIYQFTKPADETTWYGSMVWKQN